MTGRLKRYLRAFGKDVWVLSIGWFVSALGFAISIPFVSIYFYSRLGLSLSQIGFFFAGMAVVRSIFQVIGGEASDRIERRFLLIYSQFMRAGAFVLLAAAIYYDWGFPAIAGSLLVNSVFGAVFQPSANAMVSDLLPVEKRLDGYAVTRSAGNLGWGVGPALGGFLAAYSYGVLFLLSAGITLLSGLVFFFFLRSPKKAAAPERFRLAHFVSIKNDANFAWHCILIFLLYLVVAQLIATFSVYAVDLTHITKDQLGLLYTVNGLMVVSAQVPVTKLLSHSRLTIQLATGAFLYAFGYGAMGLISSFGYFVLAITVVTVGEIFMSPPALALTSRLAPEGETGRYMGVFGFFVSSGWSFGPVYGGLLLDRFGKDHLLAWSLIASLAAVSGLGYLLFTKRLSGNLNNPALPPKRDKES